MFSLRRAVLALAAVSCASCASSSSDDHGPSRKACEQYRSHVVEVRLEGVTQDRDAHRTALLASLGDQFVDRCVAETAPGELRCAMAASTIDTLRACSAPEGGAR
jgi:hypothetical protein